jgi:hypothetical protein
VKILALSLKVNRPFLRAGFVPALICFLILMNPPFLSPVLPEVPPSHADWLDFERKVRDGALCRPAGEKLIAEWAERLEKEFSPAQFQLKTCFPLLGYSLRDVGGKNGDGYKPEGYRFLDGNRHQGHPAQDIFVRDRDKDGADDSTAGPVDVLALAEGVVLSTFSGWKEGDQTREIRGGNYVWIYHPALKAFSYYAHLGKVFVYPGDRVQGGGRIATLGRTGKNASLPRSPTHLHLMILSSASMEPLNPFPFLKSSTLKGSSLPAPVSFACAVPGSALWSAALEM